MVKLVEIIAKALVDQPDAVEVNEVQGEQSLIIELKVVEDFTIEHVAQCLTYMR